MGELVWIDLGRAPYDEAMAVQRERVEQTLLTRKRGGRLCLRT